MSISSGEETKRVYPFDFNLSISYRLEGDTLYATNKVTNTGDGDMLFSIGAHPGFNINIGDTARLSDGETLSKYVADENGIITTSVPFLNGERDIVITDDIFDNDAVILPSPASTSAELIDGTGKAYLKMEFGKVPYLLLWAKPKAPYVCFEPWHGICDFKESTGELENKPGIITLPPAQSFEQKYSITVI